MLFEIKNNKRSGDWIVYNDPGLDFFGQQVYSNTVTLILFNCLLNSIDFCKLMYE